MKPEDIQDLLASIDLCANKLDRTHVKQLYNMAAEIAAGVRRDIMWNPHQILEMLNKNVGALGKRHIKKLYKIAIDYDLNPKCYACNQPILNMRDFSWDHLHPRCGGGQDNMDNLYPMHKMCNEQKGAQIFENLFDVQYAIIIVPQVIVVDSKMKEKFCKAKCLKNNKFEQRKSKKR